MSWVLFFDGDCGVCSSSIRWIAKRDSHRRIAFAPLQGRLAKALDLAQHDSEIGGTVVLRCQSTGATYYYSDAVIQVLVIIGGVWRLVGLLKWVPKFLRDRIYRMIADRRRLISKKLNKCNLSDVDWSDRMLD